MHLVSRNVILKPVFPAPSCLLKLVKSGAPHTSRVSSYTSIKPSNVGAQRSSSSYTTTSTTASASASAAAAHQEVATPREGAKEQAAAAGSADAGGAAAHVQAAGTSGDSTPVQPPHSSRGYKPGGAAGRTLSSGTAANIVGPAAKGGLARMSVRNATSVAGTTASKRWM